MEKKHLEIVITVLLLAVFIIAALNALGVMKLRAKQKAPAVSSEAKSVAFVPELKKASELTARAQDAEWAALNWGRCPLSGFIYSSRNGEIALKLSGILMDGVNQKALINDVIVGVGESIGSYKIIKINSRSVVVSNGMQEMEMRLE